MANIPIPTPPTPPLFALEPNAVEDAPDATVPWPNAVASLLDAVASAPKALA